MCYDAGAIFISYLIIKYDDFLYFFNKVMFLIFVGWEFVVRPVVVQKNRFFEIF